MSAQTQQSQKITDDEWLRAHRDQLARQDVPAAVHAIIARKMNHEVFDSATTFMIEDNQTRVVKATPKHGDAWIADHALVFRAPTDAKAALAQYPGLAERFATMARCKPEDALDKAIWRYAQALPGARPPVWCVEDEIGNGFMRGSPVAIGTAHITDRRTGDTFALYWPESDLDVGSAPRRDPYPHIKPGLRRDALLSASTDSSERWRAAYDAFSTQQSASSEVPASSNTKPPATTPLKVWTDVAWTSEVTDPRIEFVEDVSDADAVFAHSGGAKYQVHHWQLVSWFAYEAALIKKDHLAATLRRAGLADLAPVTFDLETELDALLGFLACARTRHVSNRTISGDRSAAMAKSIPEILAYAAAGGYVAQRYVEEPHALPTDSRGRKYDVRVVALLRSAAPLELYAHDHVYVRCANKAHSLSNLDDVEVALTAMHLVERDADYPTTESFIEAFDRENPSRPWDSVMADVRATLRKAFAACASLHAGFASSTHSRAAYGCDFMLDADLKPLLLEVTLAPAPLWSSESSAGARRRIAMTSSGRCSSGDGAGD